MSLDQRSLRELWKGGRQDRLSPWMQALALAYREASKELSEKKVPNIAWVASKLSRGDGKPVARQSLHEWLAKVDQDPDWFPGKHIGAKRGPDPIFTEAKRQAIADCARKIKARGDEPTVEEVCQRCTVSSVNPETGKHFDAKLIREVFASKCYDNDPEVPWRFQRRMQRTFLPNSVVQERLAMCSLLMEFPNRTEPEWMYENIVWVDPCYSIQPGSKKQWEKMQQALKGDKGWMSDDARMYSRNLRAPKYALTQRSWEGRKVNWMIILAKGVVGIDILPLEWELTGAGMAMAARRLEGRLRDMLGRTARLPRIIFSDRGTGMYAPAGQAVREYADAVRDSGFKLFWGEDASAQASDMPDLVLHETAVSWFRAEMRRTKVECLPWLETPEQWSRRAMRAIDAVNLSCDVAGLCRQFRERLDDCIGAGGDRLGR